ncbi:MAG: hypothetical protein WC780_15545 [Lentimicrobiaceae bacterium]
MKTRLKGIDDAKAVHIPQTEIVKRFFPYPAYNLKQELQRLVDAGMLRISKSQMQSTGYTMFMYEALLPGAVDLYLIKPHTVIYDDDSMQMIEHLKNVSMDHSTPELTPYFKSFLKFQADCRNLLFKIDDFSGRVHTPITSLTGLIRNHLLLYGQTTVGIDVATMQPLLLGKMLKQTIGTNDFSSWIDAGEDIYIMLQLKAGLETREQGKKRFFEILFAPANNNLASMFGDTDWITWINWYKNQPEPRNPHNVRKPYSNVAWTLQTTEVSVMRKVWHGLNKAGIPFLSVHDEVIVKEADQQKALSIFKSILDDEFAYYKLSVKGLPVLQPAFQLITPNASDVRCDFIGSDGLLHIYQPGIPEFNQTII